MNSEDKWLETKIISRYQTIAEEFFPKILGLDCSDVFLTDGSSLLDFIPSLHELGDRLEREEDIPDYFISYTNRLVKTFFHVPIGDLDQRMLIDIFKRINDYRTA